MTYIGFQITAIIFCPIIMIVSLFLLYFYLGVSFLVGTGIMILVMLLTFILSRILAKVNEELLKAKDARMKVTE